MSCDHDMANGTCSICDPYVVQNLRDEVEVLRKQIALDTGERPRPAYERALRLIEVLNVEGCGRVLHGALQAAVIAHANDLDARAERHRGGSHD